MHFPLLLNKNVALLTSLLPQVDNERSGKRLKLYWEEVIEECRRR